MLATWPVLLSSRKILDLNLMLDKIKYAHVDFQAEEQQWLGQLLHFVFVFVFVYLTLLS